MIKKTGNLFWISVLLITSYYRVFNFNFINYLYSTFKYVSFIICYIYLYYSFQIYISTNNTSTGKLIFLAVRYEIIRLSTISVSYHLRNIKS